MFNEVRHNSQVTRTFRPHLAGAAQNKASSLLNNKGSYTSPNLGPDLFQPTLGSWSSDIPVPPLPKHNGFPEVQSLVGAVNTLCILTATLLSKHEVKTKAVRGRSSSHRNRGGRASTQSALIPLAAAKLCLQANFVMPPVGILQNETKVSRTVIYLPRVTDVYPVHLS